VIKLKRAYDEPDRKDGTRYLIDRLWPRGVRKTQLRIDAWLKDVAPTTGLRQFFSHNPKKWAEFQRRYRNELRANGKFLEPILRAARGGTVTLVYAARDSERNNAVVLKQYIDRKRATRSSL
jgi:uncharacterized protein YeaO (DUF488 family)